MTPIVLALVSALVWGVSDFCGGKGAQRASALAVTVVSQLFSIPVLIVGVLLISGTPRASDLLWGALAGTVGLLGIVLLYRALAGGAMAIVSPVTAVTSAVVPLAAGLLLDGALGSLALVGTGCAVLAIALISATPGGRRGAVSPALVGTALAAGALFGTFFVLLGQASADTGMWAMVGVRMSSIPLGLLILRQASRRAARRAVGAGGAGGAGPAPGGIGLRLPGRALRWAAVAGPLDVAANVLYLTAVTQGHLSVVAVLASLYPLSTVLLALAVDRERLRAIQVAGLGLAAGALVLVTT